MVRQLPRAHRRMSFPLWRICCNDASVGFVQNEMPITQPECRAHWCGSPWRDRRGLFVWW
jgi:hypothetical protein